MHLIHCIAVNVLLALSPTVLAGSTTAELDYLLALYEHLHANPKLSFQEQEISARIARELRDIGFHVTTGVGGFGVVAVMKNGVGPTLMLRTDMDALPVQEQTGLPYASTSNVKQDDGTTVPVMHACGHDLHMTVLVGTARHLAAERNTWQGTLMLIAQPAEERGAGARLMLADGLFERFPRPDYNLALHTSAELPENLLPEVQIKDEYTPAVFNDPMLVDRVVSVLSAELGESSVHAVPPVMAGEDFARYGRTEPPIPSMLFWLGAVDPDRYSTAMSKGESLPALHSPLFTPLPEPAIETGIRAFTALTRNLLPSQ